uniref:Transmembrane protein 217 n=1 Tax=Molossus molossus TaxID=27622 RepID=A0A7J8GQJ5_MOLMO|nr:hypothetical protein HJG59_011255 [Molossus molossus]
MNGKMFPILVGIFSIFNTIQFLIFDLNELTSLGYEDKFDIYMDSNSGLASWVLINKKQLSIGLSVITITAGALLLHCLQVNNYIGSLCYTVWIITYELTSFAMVLLINGALKDQFKELGYLHLIFQISRMFLHFFCLPFVIKFAYTLYKDPKTYSKISRRRLSSISTIDSWSPVGTGMMYRKLN